MKITYHEFLLTTIQKTKLRNVFENNMSTDIKLSEAQISKVIQCDGFLGSLLSKIADPLITVVVPLAKRVWAPLGIIAAASAIDVGIHRALFQNNYSNKSKLRNEWHNGNCPSSWKILISYWKELLKQLKMKPKNKKEDF